MTTLRLRPVAALAALLLPAPLAAQELAPPPHWEWRTDRPAVLATGSAEPSDSVWLFVEMPPGWHVTTGPGAVMFDPAQRAERRYGLEAQVALFPVTSDAGYGIFFGAASPDVGAGPYAAFVVRPDGASAVQVREGGEVRTLLPWTRAPHVEPYPGSGVHGRVLRVDVGVDSVRFSIDGGRVGSLPRGALPADGLFGLRVGPRLNLHVTRLDRIEPLAPVPGADHPGSSR